MKSQHEDNGKNTTNEWDKGKKQLGDEKGREQEGKSTGTAETTAGQRDGADRSDT